MNALNDPLCMKSTFFFSALLSYNYACMTCMFMPSWGEGHASFMYTTIPCFYPTVILSNHVFIFQVARFLIKTVSQLASGKQPVGTTAYMSRLEHLLQSASGVRSGAIII